MLESAASGMNFMWIEIVIALGRLELVAGLPKLTDWTALPSAPERRPRAQHPPQRWAHGFLLGTGALASGVSPVEWYPEDPEAVLTRINPEPDSELPAH